MKRYIEFFDDAKTSAVEKLNNFLENLSKGSIYKVAGYQANTDCAYILLEVENELANQLDEPEKVKVPQFVADVIEGAREQSVELEDAFEYVWEVATGELREWFRKLENRNNFARAWLDGYEVEEEKRYLVKMKGMSEENTYLTFRFGHTWMLSNFEECEEFRLHHTRKELEDAGFGWVFNCEGIEIEEVEV
jgi:hypothetical protein